MQKEIIQEEQSFEEYWKTLEWNSETLEMSHSETIAFQHPLPVDSRWLDSLPELNIDISADSRPELELGKTLGEGGLSIVYLATQCSLGRDVALKVLRSDEQTEESTHKLLQEARITGMLEHPNIIPVHLLGKDKHNQPVLVMKRIEGVSWRDILEGKAVYPTRCRLEHDPLLCHLNILLEVGQAVQFAHSRGVIHRDLKPENVMIGRFGEVYLLDWGLAVSLFDDPQARLPLAKEIHDVAGTPAYMAPEMAAGKGENIGEATDIYLLGAILHELLTGKPIHQGESLFAVIFHAYRSPPFSYDENLPRELVAICQKATHPSPEKRFGSVEEFLQAIHDFLQHRQSLEVSAQAQQRLERLRHLFESQNCCDEGLSAYDLFGQSRFGFEEALRMWEENKEAHQGLQDTMELMISHHLEQGASHNAEALLRQLPQPNPALGERLKALQESQHKEEQHIEELKELQRDLDLEVGAKPRFFYILLVGIGWSLFTIFSGIMERISGPVISTTQHLVALSIAGVLLAATIYLSRRYLFQNTINRRFVLSLSLAFLTLFLLKIAGAYLRTPPHQLVTYSMVTMTVIFAMMAITMDTRVFAIPLVYLFAALLCAFFCKYVFFIAGVANLIAFTKLAFVWRPKEFCEMEEKLHGDLRTKLKDLRSQLPEDLARHLPQ